MNSEVVEILKGIELVKTCDACPEQYDAFYDGKQVGYFRLRHGYFSVTYPDVSGELVYSSEPNGDGMFDYDERDRELTAACLMLAGKIHEELNENI